MYFSSDDSQKVSVSMILSPVTLLQGLQVMLNDIPLSTRSVKAAKESGEHDTHMLLLPAEPHLRTRNDSFSKPLWIKH